MFNKFNLFFLLSFFVYCSTQAQQTPAEGVSGKIADRMKDSLTLSATQRDTVYAINMRLHNLKMAVRQQYQSTDSLKYKMQRVENTRDSLYLPVLGTDKFSLYLQKKKNLVNNN